MPPQHYETSDLYLPMAVAQDRTAAPVTVVHVPRFHFGFTGQDPTLLRERLRAYRDPDRPEVRGLPADYRAALITELVAALAAATPEAA